MTMRLDKLLTHLGVASRSGVRDILKAGRVRVNGAADSAWIPGFPATSCCISPPGY